jgi:hypothetical protein
MRFSIITVIVASLSVTTSAFPHTYHKHEHQQESSLHERDHSALLSVDHVTLHHSQRRRDIIKKIQRRDAMHDVPKRRTD